MKTVYITRRETFNAAHKLYREDWSEQKNWEVFGKCSNHNWHGHNFTIYVTVKGIPNPDTGFVINLKDLSEIVKQEVVEPLDHKNLNLDVPEFADLNPTAENIAVVIWQKLRKYIDANKDLEVVLYETPRNFVTYNGN